MPCWRFDCLSAFMSSKYAWSDYFLWSYPVFIYEYEVSFLCSCKYWHSISFSRIPIDEKICISSSLKFIDAFMNPSITIISDDLIWNFFHKLYMKNLFLLESSSFLRQKKRPDNHIRPWGPANLDGSTQVFLFFREKHFVTFFLKDSNPR